MGRHYLGVELIPEYVELAKKRTALATPSLTLFSQLETPSDTAEPELHSNARIIRAAQK
jgi:hypothetical protein